MAVGTLERDLAVPNGNLKRSNVAYDVRVREDVPSA